MKQHTSEEIQAILQEKRAGATLKELAAKYGVGVSTISTWNKRFGANGKAKPKRKTARKAKKSVSPDKQWEGLFNDYIESRNAAQKALDDAEAAKKRLEAFVKELK